MLVRKNQSTQFDLVTLTPVEVQGVDMVVVRLAMSPSTRLKLGYLQLITKPELNNFQEVSTKKLFDLVREGTTFAERMEKEEFDEEESLDTKDFVESYILESDYKEDVGDLLSENYAITYLTEVEGKFLYRIWVKW